jgi:hypothetical protein
MDELLPLRPVRRALTIRPLAGAKCRVEFDAVVDWGTAIELIKVLGLGAEEISLPDAGEEAR